MTNTTTTTTAIAKALSYNNRFKNNRLITSEQISEESFKEWKTAVSSLHTALYPVALVMYNNVVTGNDAKPNLDAVYTFVNTIVDMVGDIHGYPIDKRAFAEAMINYLAIKSSKHKNEDTPALSFLRSQLRNNQMLVRKYSAMNGVSADAIEELNTKIEDIKAKIKTMEEQPDNCVPKFTMASLSTFRRELERVLGDTVNNRLGKTPEELKAEDEARKEARRAARKAAKAAKAAK